VVLSRGERTPQPEIVRHALARRILESVDGQKTIDEIAFLLHARPFPVLKFLHEAHRLGLVRADRVDGPSMMLITRDERPAHESALAGPDRVAAARERLEGGDAEGALALLDNLEGSTASPDVRELRESAEHAFLRRVYDEEFAEDAVLEATCPLDSVLSERMRPEEYFLLSRMDGSSTVRHVLDIAPAREIETVRVLRRLLRRGLIREIARARV
jgi:hypothetical protein